MFKKRKKELIVKTLLLQHYKGIGEMGRRWLREGDGNGDRKAQMKIVSKISDYREELSPDGNLDTIHSFHDNRTGASRQTNARCKIYNTRCKIYKGSHSRTREADLRT